MFKTSNKRYFFLYISLFISTGFCFMYFDPMLSEIHHHFSVLELPCTIKICFVYSLLFVLNPTLNTGAFPFALAFLQEHLIPFYLWINIVCPLHLSLFHDCIHFFVSFLHPLGEILKICFHITDYILCSRHSCIHCFYAF